MILSGTVFVSTIYGAAIVWYRLYLHPPSKYPGPFCKYYEICLTFRITPNSVLINTPSGLKTIYNNKANVKEAVCYKVYHCNVHVTTTWISIDNATHARKRRAMNHAFSDKALRSSEPFIHSNIDRWIELLKEEIRKRQWSCSLHMARWADRLVFDTLGDLYFGESFGTKELFTSTIHSIGYSPCLDYLLAAAAPPAMSKAQIEDEMQARCKSGTESRKDFFQYLVLALDLETGKGCSNEEVFSESGSLIIAGSDTSAIGLAAAFFYLTRNPHAQEKHAKESRAAFSSVGGIQGGAALHSSQYLRAFIQGTMRMSPPVPTDIAPEVQQGTKASTVSYCMHHDPDMYPEPFKFRPERDSPESIYLAESAFMTFSAGPRGCVGKNLAYLEMSLTLAKTVYHFKIRRDHSSNIGGGSSGAINGRRIVDQYQL
ncbi:cytochrome P450 monooxygenase AKT7 [Fusarium oxysporum]|nr:cytochrome P450 monooxygenase AKT7 [Fusarium oxysporum]